MNQTARLSGAVTVPDVLRDRFASPALGITASLLILLFLIFNLVAQFKAAGLVMKEALRVPARRVELPLAGWSVDQGYLFGLLIFSATVVTYTTTGGYWTVAWTDVLEALVKFAGVVVLAVLAVRAVEPIDGKTGLPAATERLRRLAPPGGQAGELVTAPGPRVVRKDGTAGMGFLPLGLAFSYFCLWSLNSAGQPSSMVRLMTARDTDSLRRGLVVVSVYYVLTYVCLLVIFICARARYPTQYMGGPGSEGEPDSIMPAMARNLAPPFLAGLLLAAPYAAIMSTVAAFLLMISSSLVRDLYQRIWDPKASERRMRLVSYTVTALVGVGVTVAAINPPNFLQYIIVFTGTGQGCAFLMPVLLTLYWRRATRQGVLAGMLGGGATVLGLYALGWLDSRSAAALQEHGPAAAPASAWVQAHLGWLPGWGEERPDAFAPLYPCGLDPVVWGMLASLLLAVGVSLATRPDEARARLYFPEAEGKP
jgi:SSS family solute:Na+ symporter/sodium/pantothenate symporter